MTGKQKDWLERNPMFRPVGRTGGKTYFEGCGLLSADGVYQAGVTTIAPPPLNSPDHAIVVGVLMGF